MDATAARLAQEENGTRGDPSLTDLDAGEREAILLAAQTEVRLIILDERAGRAAASKRGLALTGTIGVLAAAVRRGLVDAADATRRLR